jgi:hypothetical protein
MAKLRASPKFHVEKNDGTPAVGWQVFTYEPGTSTKKATYTDSTEAVANSNPVILDSRGEEDIWWAGIYKVIISDETDTDPPTNAVITVDNYGAGETVQSSNEVNLIPNGSFETDEDSNNQPDNWDVITYTGGTSTLDTSDQTHGGKSMKFISTGNGGGYITTSSFFEVSSLQDTIFLVDIKSSVTDVRNLIQIFWYDETQTALGEASSTLYDESLLNPTDWSTFRTSVLPPSGAKYAKLRLYGCHESDSTSGTTWYDNVRVLFPDQVASSIGLILALNGQASFY